MLRKINLNFISRRSFCLRKAFAEKNNVNLGVNLGKDSTEGQEGGKDNKQETKQDNKETQEKKQTKHIYKQGEPEPEVEIIRDEAVSYSEGFNDGIYVKRQMSYVYYEMSPKSSTTRSEVEGEENKVEKKDQDKKEKVKTTSSEEEKLQTPDINKKI